MMRQRGAPAAVGSRRTKSRPLLRHQPADTRPGFLRRARIGPRTQKRYDAKVREFEEWGSFDLARCTLKDHDRIDVWLEEYLEMLFVALKRKHEGRYVVAAVCNRFMFR